MAKRKRQHAVTHDEDGDLVLPHRRAKHRWLFSKATTILFNAVNQGNKDTVLRQLLSCPVAHIDKLLDARDPRK